MLALAGCATPQQTGAADAQLTDLREATLASDANAPGEFSMKRVPAIPQTNDELVAYILAGRRVNAAPYAGGERVTIFTLPSNNISCYLWAGDVITCQIKNASWPPVPETDCYSGYFDQHLIWMDDGYIQQGDCSDMVLPVTLPGKILPYGSSVFYPYENYYGVDNTACRAERIGIACADMVRHTGFFMSEDAFISFPSA